MAANKKNKKSESKVETSTGTHAIKAVIWLYEKPENLKASGFDKELISMLKDRHSEQQHSFHIRTTESAFWFEQSAVKEGFSELERLRKAGAAVFAAAQKASCSVLRLVDV
ncbi:MAG: hypothetical protein KJS92_07165, partial [Bacteroidetes bacterium]|nr:hypothetical protein [Bacteroidota bacterium]